MLLALTLADTAAVTCCAQESLGCCMAGTASLQPTAKGDRADNAHKHPDLHMAHASAARTTALKALYSVLHNTACATQDGGYSSHCGHKMNASPTTQTYPCCKSVLPNFRQRVWAWQAFLAVQGDGEPHLPYNCCI